MIAVASVALFSGLLIGSIGIGGVVLVPALTLMGIEIHEAVAASLFSFVFSGIVATAVYSWRGSIDLRPALRIGLGALPGAYGGSVIAGMIGAAGLQMIVGSAVVAAGIRTLRPSLLGAGPDRSLDVIPLISIGFGVGVISAMTGTGGALLLMPLLMILRAPLLLAIGLAQVVQLPIAVASSLGNLIAGTLDTRLAAEVTVGVAIGTLGGAMASNMIPKWLLTRAVGLALLSVGILLIAQSTRALI
ncbi:MAG TPA: sulfite exporter TauE/SafE family protein [Stellaceae bacterium]|nr:sulfite exporter TauE/SafE family protein [Stellaceae bacterium]